MKSVSDQVHDIILLKWDELGEYAPGHIWKHQPLVTRSLEALKSCGLRNDHFGHFIFLNYPNIQIYDIRLHEFKTNVNHLINLF